MSKYGFACDIGRKRLTETDVTAVVSYYTMYKRKPAGEYHVGVCTNTLCAVMGGDAAPSRGFPIGSKWGFIPQGDGKLAQ